MNFDVRSQQACRYDRHFLQPVATMQNKLNAGTQTELRSSNFSLSFNS